MLGIIIPVLEEELESFKLGANRNAWNEWHGWLDELRISFKLHSADYILASYESQRLDANLLHFDK